MAGTSNFLLNQMSLILIVQLCCDTLKNCFFNSNSRWKFLGYSAAELRQGDRGYIWQFVKFFSSNYYFDKHIFIHTTVLLRTHVLCITISKYWVFKPFIQIWPVNMLTFSIGRMFEVPPPKTKTQLLWLSATVSQLPLQQASSIWRGLVVDNVASGTRAHFQAFQNNSVSGPMRGHITTAAFVAVSLKGFHRWEQLPVALSALLVTILSHGVWFAAG